MSKCTKCVATVIIGATLISTKAEQEIDNIKDLNVNGNSQQIETKKVTKNDDFFEYFEEHSGGKLTSSNQVEKRRLTGGDDGSCIIL